MRENFMKPTQVTLGLLFLGGITFEGYAVCQDIYDHHQVQHCATYADGSYGCAKSSKIEDDPTDSLEAHDSDMLLAGELVVDVSAIGNIVGISIGRTLKSIRLEQVEADSI